MTAAAGVYRPSRYNEIERLVQECMIEPDPAPVLVFSVAVEVRRRAA